MITADDIRAGRVAKHRVIYDGTDTYADCERRPKRWKVTFVKLWKSRPTEFVISVSFGMYTFRRITDTNGWAGDFFLTEEEAKQNLDKRKAA
jgi:hypothetical protein